MCCVHVARGFWGETCSVTNYSMAASSLLSSAPSSIIFTLSPVLLVSKGGGSWSGCANGHGRSFRAFPSATRDCHHRSWSNKRARKSLSVVAASASSRSSSNPGKQVLQFYLFPLVGRPMWQNNVQNDILWDLDSNLADVLTLPNSSSFLVYVRMSFRIP